MAAHKRMHEEVGKGVDGVGQEGCERDVTRQGFALLGWHRVCAHVAEVLQRGLVVLAKVLARLEVEGPHAVNGS